MWWSIPTCCGLWHLEPEEGKRVGGFHFQNRLMGRVQPESGKDARQEFEPLCGHLKQACRFCRASSVSRHFPGHHLRVSDAKKPSCPEVWACHLPYCVVPRRYLDVVGARSKGRRPFTLNLRSGYDHGAPSWLSLVMLCSEGTC